MTDSNRVRLAYVEESQYGVTPVTPNMRLLRYTGHNLSYDIDTIESSEIDDSGQVADLIQTGARVNGGYNLELSFGEHDEFIAGTMFNTWSLLPERNNDGVADSVVTAVTDTTDTYTVASGGASFLANMLVKASGFTNAANNRVFVVGSSTATTVVASGTPTLVDETAPPALARLKVIGVTSTAGDITATATGLASTALNWTTLGLQAYQWIKIGGPVTASQFATAADNGWARISGTPTATTLPLDHLPDGWAIDAGAGKTIRIYFGDDVRNGSTVRSFTFESGYLGQATPYYIPMIGEVPSRVTLNIAPGEIVNGSITFLGKQAGVATTTPLDASPLPSKTSDILNAVTDVLRIAEGGVTVAAPSYVLGLTIEAGRELREKTAVGVMGLVGVGTNKFRATGTISVYFEDAVIYNKVINGTETSIAVVIGKAGQAYVIQFPRVQLSNSAPTVGGADQFVVLETTFTALRDSAASDKTMIVNRIEYEIA